MTSDGYLRFPHVRGDLLTFAADDDVWLAPAGGGRAWRVSCDRVPAAHPRLSPDGARIAWTTTADGAPEVRVAEVETGQVRRLTWWGDPATRAVGWSPDGDVLAVSAAGQPFDRFTWAHAVAVDGAPPRRLPFGVVADLAMAGDAAALLTGCWGRDPAWWKRYRGGAAGRLWVRRAGEEAFRRVLAGVAGQFASPMLAWGRLVFLCDHEGTANLYSCDMDGGDLRRHTDHDGFYARQASTDGQRVVYQRAGDIWILDGPDAQAQPVGVSLGAGPPPPALVRAEDHLGSLSCDETGRASAIEVRGAVHWLTHRDGPARALHSSPRSRARLPKVLGATGQVVWVSDEGGEDGLDVAPAADADTPPRRLGAGRLGRVESLACAPDGSAIAVAARDGRVHLVDPATGEAALLATSADGPATGLAFSPDSAWLAWSQPGPRPLSRIRLARCADATVLDVTDGRFTDTEPVFTGDGLYLAFLSRRSFDPVYDAHFFDLSFPYGCRPHLVALAAATPSPFAPLPEGRAAGGDPPGPPGAPGGGGPQAPPAPPETRLDADGLASRVIAVPVQESLYSSLRAVTGGLAWMRAQVTGVLGEGLRDVDEAAPRPCLERFDFRRRTCVELAGQLDWFQVSGDGSRLVIFDQGRLRVAPSERPVDSEDGADVVQVDLARARHLADAGAQRRHALAEFAAVMRHDFWVADMADVDWDGVVGSYQPLVQRVRTGEEFADLLHEVAGELGTSHAYVRAAGRQAESPGLGSLGADLELDGDGWQVARVLPGESSDPRARSPLAAPGVAAERGEALLAVDGQPVDPRAGPGPLLAGAAGKPVELTLARGGQRRTVAVVPLASDRRLRYQDWVAGNRRQVRELSGGAAGYLHVPDMMGEGWAHFHRDLRLEMARDLLIVDVRNNRGGHLSELVVEKLARRVMGWHLPRGLLPATYPLDAPRGPLVAIADEYAGSDGDMVTAAVKILRLGPVVGTRTWGGVVGFDDPFTLWDGTEITVPRYGISLAGFGWEVENHGVEPDVEVLISPQEWAAGHDPQLETAVRLGLAALAERPAAAPPGAAGRPSRRRPPLPPRPEAGAGADPG